MLMYLKANPIHSTESVCEIKEPTTCWWKRARLNTKEHLGDVAKAKAH